MEFDFEIVIQDMDDYHEVSELLKREKRELEHIHESTDSSIDPTLLERHVVYLEARLSGWMRRHLYEMESILLAQGI